MALHNVVGQSEQLGVFKCPINEGCKELCKELNEEDGMRLEGSWKPTMMLRWREDDWNATLADFDKTLEQMWISDTGEEKWEEVPLSEDGMMADISRGGSR